MDLQHAVGQTMAATNMLLALLIVWYQSRKVWACRKKPPPWCWLRMVLVFISLAWAGVYCYVLIGEPGAPSDAWVREVIFRPIISVTLGTMAASAIARGKEE